MCRDREIGGLNEVKCGEERRQEEESYPLQRKCKSICASRMHEMRRVSAGRDNNKSRISLRPFLSFLSFFFRASKMERKGKKRVIDASPVSDGTRLD